MHWITIAICAYFLVSLEVILDKFLLSSKKVSHPAVYAFYSGALSFFTLFLIPFGARMVSFHRAVEYMFFGVVFVYGILFIFYAISRSEASRVMPVVGAIIPIVTFILSDIFSAEHLTSFQILGFLTLIFGGLFISFNLPLKGNKNKFFAGFYFSIFAGILLAIAFTAFKRFYAFEGSFTTVFVWTRLGLVAGALTLLLNPYWRNLILHSSKNFKNREKENIQAAALFVANKTLGGIGSILINLAISLGSVTIVNALVSIEYVFIFILGISFSVRFPKIFEETGNPVDIFQKIAAIFVIALGLILVSVKI